MREQGVYLEKVYEGGGRQCFGMEVEGGPWWPKNRPFETSSPRVSKSSVSRGTETCGRREIGSAPMTNGVANVRNRSTRR